MAKDRNQDLIFSSEAGRILEKSDQTVRNYVDRGRLTAMKMADGTRILNRAEVERLARELKQKEG